MAPKAYGNKSIRNKLLATYVVAMGSALVITFMVLAILINIDIQKKLYNSDLQSTKVFSKYLKIKVDEIRNISSDIVKDYRLQQELKDTESNRKNDAIQGILNKFMLNNNDIDAVYLVDNNNNLYIADSEPFYEVNAENFLELNPSEEIISQRGGVFHYIGNKGYMENSKDTIIVARSIISQEDFSKLGYITIYIKRNVLDRMYREFTDYINLDFIINDAIGNKMTFSQNENNEDNNIQVLKYNENKYSNILINNKSKDSVVDNFDLLSGQIITISDIKSTNEYILIVLILLAVLNSVFLIVYNIYVSKYVIDPLDKIVEDSKNIGVTGDLKGRFKVEGSYLELDYIINALNDMMDKINNLIGEIKIKQKLQNKLELDRLNSQIKPHFLYNTLGVVSSLITVNETESANELIFTLARYYRESLNSGEEIVDLGKEISILYDYVCILKLRKNILFNIKYTIEPAVIEYKIPKLTLQPLIENSFKYAIVDEDTLLNIEVIAKLDNESKDCIITVADDGTGMKEETLNAIYAGESLNLSSGFGLKSVFERIALYYDVENPFDLIKINSKIGKGTRIEIRLPFNEENI